METAPIRVVIADDHPIITTGLDRLLADSAAITLVGSFQRFAALLTAGALDACDVLILDLGGMGAGPIVMLRRLRSAYPQIPVVVFSSSVDMAPEVLRAGAIGYVAKDDLLDHLLSAIQHAHAGKTYLSPIALMYVQRAKEHRRIAKLTDSEFVTLKLMVQGHRTPKLAELMAITERAVQNHICHMLDKTGCEDRVQLVEWYRRMYGADESAA